MPEPVSLPQKLALRSNVSRFLRRNRGPLLLLIAVAVVAVTQLALTARFIPMLKLEEAAVDFRFRLRGNVPASPNCAIIGINASSLDPSNFDPSDVARSEALQLMQQPFPWNRKVYALLLDKLMAAGARAVALDILFLNEADGDDDLAGALRKYGDRVVIGSVFVQESPDSNDFRQIYRAPEKRLLSAAGTKITGCVTLPEELDGAIRKTWYLTSELREDGFDDNSRDIISMAGLAASKFNPHMVLPDGVHAIDFQGPRTTYPYLPIEEVFMDRVFSGSRQFDFGNVFKDKLVFVGPVAELFHDTHYTPYGVMPGVEIQAQIVGSLLSGTTLRDAPDWMALALSIPMALLAAWAGWRMTHALALSGFLAGGICLFTCVAQWLFGKQGLLIPMVSPLIGFAGTGLFGLIFNLLVEQLERARIRSVLDRYVSKNVAQLVLAETDQFELALRGKRKCVTVLLSDIREFTTLTEAAVPEDLVGQLNEYFYEMVNAVLAAKGTLQQIAGDEILAVWGNTHLIDPAAGARQGVQTALAMSAALQKLNANWLGNPSRRRLRIGIGVNYGEVVVGSVGHPLRMEFASVGDGTNTAARLESATKQFGCEILVGEAVESLTREWFHYRQVGRVQLKGKLKTIEVYTPLDEISAPCPLWFPAYREAVELYRGRDFQRAYAAFEAVRAQIGGEDGLCEMYLARCKSYLSNPPAADWDGSWALTEK